LQGFGSGSALDPDPRLIIQLEIQKGKYKINHLFLLFQRENTNFLKTFSFFSFIFVKMLEKKCMNFFKYFFTLKNSGLGSVSGSVSASDYKTLDPDPDPQEMDADPKPWFLGT